MMGGYGRHTIRTGLTRFSVVLSVLVCSGLATCAQFQNRPDRKHVRRMLLSLREGNGIDSWRPAYDATGCLADTVLLYSYPYGYRSNDPCHLTLWTFRSASRMEIAEGQHCTEPPVNILKSIGAKVKWDVVERGGRPYVTLVSGHLPLATFEVLTVLVGDPFRAGGMPHMMTMLRQKPW